MFSLNSFHLLPVEEYELEALETLQGTYMDWSPLLRRFESFTYQGNVEAVKGFFFWKASMKEISFLFLTLDEPHLLV